MTITVEPHKAFIKLKTELISTKNNVVKFKSTKTLGQNLDNHKKSLDKPINNFLSVTLKCFTSIQFFTFTCSVLDYFA